MQYSEFLCVYNEFFSVCTNTKIISTYKRYKNLVKFL